MSLVQLYAGIFGQEGSAMLLSTIVTWEFVYVNFRIIGAGVALIDSRSSCCDHHQRQLVSAVVGQDS